MTAEIEKHQKAFQKAIKSLEKRRKSRIFCFVQTDKEHIASGTYGLVLAARPQLKDTDTLEILLHSGGGHPEVAYQAIKFLRRHCNKLNIIVPAYAKSAATLMCLLADNIYMGELAEL